jgi:hypothetical protein
LSQWASTAYATSEIVAWTAANVPALLPVAQTWAILQYYFGGIAVNTINPPTGGTLLIGNSSIYNNIGVDTETGRTSVLHLGDGNTSTGGIHIGNGLNTSGNVNILNGIANTGTINLGSSTSTTHIHTPLTPMYTYPITRVGAIGYVLPVTFITNSASGGTNSAGVSLRSVSIPPGVWLIAGTARTSVSLVTYMAAFSTVQNNNTGLFLARYGTFRIDPQRPTGVGITTMTTYVFTTTTTLYFNVRSDTVSIMDYVNYTVMRLG